MSGPKHTSQISEQLMIEDNIPPLNSLRAFRVAALRESFIGAGDDLGVSSGAISRHVKVLEKYLKVTLFERHTNGVVLTHEGRRYASSVTQLFNHLALETANTRRPERTRRLTISTLPVFSEQWLDRRLSTFLKRCDEIDVTLEVHNRIHGFLSGDIDAWIVYSDGNHPGWDITPLFGEELVPVSSPELRRTLPTNPTAQHVARLPFIHDAYWRDDWPAWARAMGVFEVDLSLGPRFALYCSVLRAAIAGVGVAIGHTALIRDELASGHLVPYEGLGLRIHFIS